MRFTEHYNLVEKMGYGKEYKVPKDREQRLYDFYALSMVYPPKDLFDAGNQADEIYYFTDALEKITTALVDDFKTVLRFALSAELGHIGSQVASMNPKMDDPYAEKYQVELYKLTRAQGEDAEDDSSQLKYSERYDLLKELFPDIIDFIEFAIDSFTEGSIIWDEEYGGDAWLKIAKGLQRIFRVEDKKVGDKIVAIDHVYDLQHNNDSVFNKVKQYYKYGGHEWLAHALDKKRDLIEPHELLDLVSPALKRPLRAGYKIVLKKSVDAVPKKNEEDMVMSFIEDKTNGYIDFNEDTQSWDVKGSDVKVSLDGVDDGELRQKWGVIEESFTCSNLGLKTLKNAPTSVGRSLFCSNNELTSLEGLPKIALYADFSKNKLTSLKGAPEKMNQFRVSENKLTSLEGAPKEVHTFMAGSNKLKSLKGGPISCVGSYNVSKNLLTDFVGCPTKSPAGDDGGNTLMWISARDNPIKSLKGLTDAVDTVMMDTKNVTDEEIAHTEKLLDIDIN